MTGFALIRCMLRWLLLLLLGMGTAHSADYKVGAGDVLKIMVFDHPELSGDFRIADSGFITVPLVGPVELAGLSTQDAEALLAALLEKRQVLPKAQVSIAVTEYVSQRVSVMGQVAKPGQYPLTEQRTLMDMLALAGGVVVPLAADDAILTRKDGTRETVDLRKLFEGDLAMNLLVVSGDTLFVPRAPQFYIYGQVQRPGVYRLERNMTLSQAIAAGGGLTPKGTEHGITIKRRGDDGKEITLNAKRAGVLRSEDVVMIKERLF